MLKGSIVALITPFDEEGKVDFEKLRGLVNWHVEKGTDGIVVLGTTGEAATMTHEECVSVVKTVVETAGGRIPVIAGSGSNCTSAMLEKSLTYEKLGVDGLLLIAPYYNKANPEGMYHHFKIVADAVKIPCILYNVPGRTGCSIPVEVVKRLSVHPNIVAIKEASGDISRAAEIARFVNDDFAMYSGNDDQVLPILSLGGSGVISVWANVMPTEVHDMVAAFLNGDVKKARELQLAYLPFINGLFMEVNPIPVKEAMKLAGMPVGGYRLPLCPMSESNREKLERIMKECGLI
ncbi:MAG: 4-hydroxy-tetrahydrodipicolinate synthase [Clostridia bacterium]|nr:4-hydroxy-tetrahydrodipicolinate synthase [Clostridia bacterium]